MNIVLAYDGSEGAKRALELLGGLVRAGDRVTAVGVAEGIPLFGYAGTLPSPEQEQERDSRLAEAEESLTAQGIAVSLEPRVGDPATAILDVAEREEAGLIVLGTRGLGIAERWLIGSVSDKVLHHAHCSVLVAR
ncbi:MAG TPA: universal stress protein [Gaiellaceae bacterium]|nr:universal stress protein [Gaiellaceae bacterium]